MKIRISVLKFILITFLSIPLSNLVQAQDNIDDKNNRHIIILNRNHEQVEMFKIDAPVQLKLKNNEKIKGTIQSIYPDYITMNSETYRFDEINKIRKLKNRTVPVVVGGALITAGVVTILTMQFYADFDDMPKIFALGLGSIVAGIIIIPAKYHNISKSKDLIVISNESR